MNDLINEHGIMPHSQDAERAVIGSIILDNTCLYAVSDFLNPDDFYSIGNEILYTTIRDMIHNSEAVDFITLKNRLIQSDKLDEIGGISYMSATVDVVGSTANTEHYGRIVKEKSRIRQLIRTASEIIDRSYRDEGAESITEFAESALASIADHKASGLLSAEKFVSAQLEYYDKLKANKHAITGIETGLIDLDRMTDGLQKGEVTIIAARPSQGKTSLATTLIVNTPDIATCFFSIEQKNEQIVNRMISKICQIDGFDLRRGRLDAHTWTTVYGKTMELATRPLWIHRGSATLNQIRATAKKLKTHHKLDLLIVDYLGLVRYQLPRNQQHKRFDVVAEISHALKNLAADLNIAVVVLVQLNRETDGHQKPELHHLRESGDIEQDGDLILFLWTMLIPPKEKGKPGDEINRITIAKQRNGSIGDIDVVFRREYTDFRNAFEERNQEPVDYKSQQYRSEE